MGRQRPRLRESGDSGATDRGLGATGDHDVGVLPHDHARRFADGMRPGRAGRHHGKVGSLETVADGNVPRDQIDEAGRDEEGAQAAHPSIFNRQRAGSDFGQAADARADQHTRPFEGLLVIRFPARILNRLDRRHQAVDDESIHAPLVLGGHPRIDIEQAVVPGAERHHTGDLRRQVGNVEGLDSGDSGLAVKQPLLVALYPTAERREEANAGNDHTSHCIP